MPGLNGLCAAAEPGIWSPEIPGWTDRLNDWVAFGDTPFEAVMVIGKLPKLDGVPESAPVAAFRVTPVGRAPDSENVGGG